MSCLALPRLRDSALLTAEASAPHIIYSMLLFPTKPPIAIQILISVSKTVRATILESRFGVTTSGALQDPLLQVQIVCFIGG